MLCVYVLLQCGPRFELRPYQIKLGTVDQAHAENEWVLRAYTRSTKKAKLALEEDDS
jgi:U3 small nucleolar ribonucleoprotein protein IMP4